MKSLLILFTVALVFSLSWAADSSVHDPAQNRYFRLDGSQTYWSVLVTSDSGKTWKLLDELKKTCRALIHGYPCLTSQKLIFSSPHTFVAVGGMTEGKYLNEWVIRWSVDDGKTWQMKKWSNGRFPIYATDVEVIDEKRFLVTGYISGFSSYIKGTKVFNVETGEFE